MEIEELKLAFDYNPLTGVFIRRKTQKPTGWVCANGYLYISLRGKQFLAHRLAWAIMMNAWPESDIDHIDRNRTNNAFANLREATRSQNLGNSGLKTTNTSGFKGVGFFKPRGKWRARITFDYREIHIGYFDTLEAANQAYEAKAKELFGDFAVAA